MQTLVTIALLLCIIPLLAYFIWRALPPKQIDTYPVKRLFCDGDGLEEQECCQDAPVFLQRQAD